MRKHTRKLLIDMQIDQVILKEKSRDDIPQLLEGLKYIFLDETLRQKIFDILLNIFPKNINLHDGRPGMDILAFVHFSEPFGICFRLPQQG